MSSTGSIRMTNEVTLRVESPILENGTSKSIKSPYCPQSSYWLVTLTLSGTNLNTKIVWHRGGYEGSTQFSSIRIYPIEEIESVSEYTPCGSNLYNGYSVECSVPSAKVTKDGVLNFDIVISTELTPARNPKTLTQAPITVLTPTRHSNIGLWGHRVVLARHKVFADLIQHQEEVQSLIAATAATKVVDDISKSESDFESCCTLSSDNTCTVSNAVTHTFVIQVDNISLVTFCALLYYIYMDEIQLKVDTTSFVISSSNSKADSARDSVLWPSDAEPSTLRFKDVTWDQLLEAADQYKISDLREKCLQKVINELNPSNVARILFNKTVSGSDLRQAAMKYVVKNWGTLFQAEKADPFSAFRRDPEWYDVLIELMQLKAKSI
ncbi:hypothetical protein FBU30_004819 [Linnemannia zychae]|nr:hypothetical protein FBU30_004819 [Linnemannia zychae]